MVILDNYVPFLVETCVLGEASPGWQSMTSCSGYDIPMYCGTCMNTRTICFFFVYVTNISGTDIVVVDMTVTECDVAQLADLHWLLSC